jgi:hypothetical protein
LLAETVDDIALLDITLLRWVPPTVALKGKSFAMIRAAHG